MAETTPHFPSILHRSLHNTRSTKHDMNPHLGSTLLAPYQMGPIQLENRMVMAPMTRGRAGKGNVPTPLMARYYAQRSTAGLIVSEATQISVQGSGYPDTPGLYNDAQVEGWKLVTQAVHEAGSKIFAQLWHVGRVSHPAYQPGGELPVAPSALRPAGHARTPDGPRPFKTPRALAVDEIQAIVADFAAAAERAREAGFDGVELHAANGYLIDQFLRDGSNVRTDLYGGSTENRARFLFEVVDAVVADQGPERVAVRLSPTSSFNDMRDSDPAGTFTWVAEQLAAYGLAYLHVYEQLAPVDGGRVTPLLRQAFPGALIVNGGFNEATGHAVLRAEEADLVAYGVPFLANPDLPRRYALAAPLNEPDERTFHGGSATGYIDYPTLLQASRAEAKA